AHKRSFPECSVNEIVVSLILEELFCNFSNELTFNWSSCNSSVSLLESITVIQYNVKGLLNDKKLETLVDPNLGGNYVEEELEQVIQVALLCTQSSPLERPKMSEVLQMLEGDGLAERWEEWQKEESSRRNFNNMVHSSHHQSRTPQFIDSTSHIAPDVLSGPR
ncbi:unnamed protein product, partial [Citrullus colocynthis]